jgi:hypothetical protein
MKNFSTDQAMKVVSSLIVFCILSFICWAFVSMVTPLPSEKRFTVVDKYKNCDVVRYRNLGRYYYFLDCQADVAPR